MLGFNGGLLGVRRTPTGSAASGMWFPNEQSAATLKKKIQQYRYWKLDNFGQYCYPGSNNQFRLAEVRLRNGAKVLGGITATANFSPDFAPTSAAVDGSILGGASAVTLQNWVNSNIWQTYSLELDAGSPVYVSSIQIFSSFQSGGVAFPVTGFNLSAKQSLGDPWMFVKRVQPIFDVIVSQNDTAVPSSPVDIFEEDWPRTGIDPANIIYSQSSFYYSTLVATNASMTDGAFTTGAATASGENQWIKMDLQANLPISNIYIGPSNFAGGWTPGYSSNLTIQYSTDDTNWTTAFVTPTYTIPSLYEYSASFSARYIRALKSSSGYVALAEFYAS